MWRPCAATTTPSATAWRSPTRCPRPRSPKRSGRRGSGWRGRLVRGSDPQQMRCPRLTNVEARGLTPLAASASGEEREDAVPRLLGGLLHGLARLLHGLTGLLHLLGRLLVGLLGKVHHRLGRSVGRRARRGGPGPAGPPAARWGEKRPPVASQTW